MAKAHKLLKVDEYVPPIFLTAYSYQHDKLDYSEEHPKGPSMTIPDQSLTVREIFDRFARNMPLDIVNRDGFFECDEDFDGDDYVDDEMYRDDYLTYNDELKRRIEYEQSKQRDQSNSFDPRDVNRDEPVNGRAEGSEISAPGSPTDDKGRE